MINRPTVARDIMARNLVTLDPQMDVFDAIDRLLKYRISGAPVVDREGRYLGVFSERCSISLLVTAAYENAPTSQIDPFIDRDVATIDPETDLLTIAERFLNTNQRRLPVLEDGRLVGQVSRRDVLKAARGLLRPTTLVSESAILYLSSVVERKTRRLLDSGGWVVRMDGGPAVVSPVPGSPWCPQTCADPSRIRRPFCPSVTTAASPLVATDR